MLKRFLIFLSRAKWAQRLITRWGVARRVAMRFVAGETLSDAVTAVQTLNTAGLCAALDFLGENSTTEAETREATSHLMEVLDAIHQYQLHAYLSIKLSQLGLLLNAELCEQNLYRVLDQARQQGIFVRIDMEDSTLTESTLAIFEHALQKGYTNVGIVLQAYLYRTEQDLQRISQNHAKVRLVKGAYNEPPSVAFSTVEEVNTNFDRLAVALLEISEAAGSPQTSADGLTPAMVAIGTHSKSHIDAVIELMRLQGIPSQAVEFQFLYGIRRDLQRSLVLQGYPVRVYTPFGTHWYPYLMRRLAERPENLKFFLSNAVKG
jgi:proline dehydrogenase